MLLVTRRTESTSTSMSDFNVRVCSSRQTADLEEEMARVGAESAGIARMIHKAVGLVVKVHGVRTPAALILKEEMLSKGGDAAIHHDCITSRVERSDVLLMGSEAAFNRVVADLHAQPFSLPHIADRISRAIECCKSAGPRTPADEVLPARLRPFYSALRERTLVMGILNVTPDSFSDGGLYGDTEAAATCGERMVAEGADLVDIGGESTRPGSDAVSPDEQVARVIPVIRKLSARIKAPISIDTTSARVAEKALDAGAQIINDISALRDDSGMARLAADRGAPVVLMHMQGTPRTMQVNPTYQNVVQEVSSFLEERIAAAIKAGISKEQIVVDPGFGFGKRLDHNLTLLRDLEAIRRLGRPVLVGTSRKRMIGEVLGVPPPERLYGTLATVAAAVERGAAVVRVHDVKAAADLVKMLAAIHGRN